MKYVDGIFIDIIECTRPDGEKEKLSLWMNPETKNLVAVDTMELPANSRSFPDPYEVDTRIRVADTFSGLPK